MRASLVVLLLVLGAAVRSAPAQSASSSKPWSVTAELGLARFGGTSVDTTGFPGDPQILPANPASYAVRVGRQVGRVRLGLGFTRLTTGLSIRSSDVIIVTREVTLTLDELTPEVALRLARLATGVELWASAGPTLDLWSFPAETTRLLLGAQGALSLEAPLAGSWAAVLRAGGSISRSVLTENDLPVDFRQRPTRRGSVGLGLAFRP